MTEAPGTDPADGAAGYDEQALAAVDRWLAYRLWHSRTPGAQVAVGVRGTPVFSRAYGYADLESRTPMRTDHLFRIASHSKTFTATLLLQLVEEGRLGVDDPLGRHLPELTGPVADVRLRELLEHTGGVLRDTRDADFWQHRRPFPDRDELVRLAQEGGLKSAPGERFAYSNVGFSLLALVVEAVTGTGLATLAQERVIAPLGLTDTAAELLPDRAGDYATGYSSLAAAPRRHRLPDPGTGAFAGAAGFTSTASDLVTYFGAHALGDERLLSDRTKRPQQRRLHDTDPARPEADGYGWGMVTESVDGTTHVGHGGGYPGHITKTLLDPATGLVVSVLTNAADGPATPLALGVVRLLARSRQRDDGPAPSPAALRRTGRYASDWDVLDLAALGGRLRALVLDGWDPLTGADELTEEGPDRFRITAGRGYGSVGEPVTVVDGDEGPALRYAGFTMRALPDLEEPDDHRYG